VKKPRRCRFTLIHRQVALPNLHDLSALAATVCCFPSGRAGAACRSAWRPARYHFRLQPFRSRWLRGIMLPH